MIPALFARIVSWANPYVMLASIPQNLDEGSVAVTELK